MTQDTSPGNAASQQPRLGWMYQIWPTSVHRVSLRGSHPSEYVDALNQRVGNAILKMFDDLVAANPNATSIGGTRTTSMRCECALSVSLSVYISPDATKDGQLSTRQHYNKSQTAKTSMCVRVIVWLFV